MTLTKFFENEWISSLSIMGLRGGMLVGKFLLSLFIARYMGLDDLGVYGLIAGAVAVGQVVMRFGLFASVSREAVNQPLHALLHNLRHYGTGCVVLYLMLMPAFFFIGAQFDYALIGLLTAIVMFLEHAAFDAFVLTNNLQRPKLANTVYALQSALWIYLFIILAFFIPALQSLEAVMYFWIGGGVVSLAIALFLTRSWPWREVFSQPFLHAWYKPYFIKSWRLYVSEIISVGILYIDRYLITLFLSLELVGIYVLFWQVSNAICNLIGAGILQVCRPRLILAYQQRDIGTFNANYKHCLMRCLGGALGLGLVAAAIVPLLIRYSEQPLALDYLGLLWLLLAAMFFRITLDASKMALFAMHKDKARLSVDYIALGMTAVTGIVLLQILGVYGAAVATMLTCTLAVAYAEFARRRC